MAGSKLEILSVFLQRKIWRGHKNLFIEDVHKILNRRTGKTRLYDTGILLCKLFLHLPRKNVVVGK